MASEFTHGRMAAATKATIITIKSMAAVLTPTQMAASIWESGWMDSNTELAALSTQMVHTKEKVSGPTAN